MRKIGLILILIFSIIDTFGQTDNNGNPVFISEVISEEKFDTFELTSNYYTIKDNISNKQSSVFLSDNPTIKDYLKFSRDMPSYFFIIHKGPTIMFMIILLQKNDGDKTTLTYNLLNPNNGKSIELPCSVWGEITEKRVDELEKIKIDTSSKIIDIPNGALYLFNGVGHRIQPYEKLKAEVVALAKQIVNGKTSETITDPVVYIKKESINGKLDFNKMLKDEPQSFFLADGVAYNKKDFAIYLWGNKVQTLGIKSSKEAVQIWEEINKKSLANTEKKALISGFESKSR